MIRAIACILGAVTFVCALACFNHAMGWRVGYSPADVDRIMATKEYKAAEAAHLAKWETK